MNSTKRILFYGNSIILGTIETTLGRYSQFEVTKLLSPVKKKQMVAAAKTDILLFDLESTHPGAVLRLLGTNPTLQLIGISPGYNLIKIWSIRELREVSMQDLIQVIKSEAKDITVRSGGNEVHLDRSVFNK